MVCDRSTTTSPLTTEPSGFNPFFVRDGLRRVMFLIVYPDGRVTTFQSLLRQGWSATASGRCGSYAWRRKSFNPFFVRDGLRLPNKRENLEPPYVQSFNPFFVRDGLRRCGLERRVGDHAATGFNPFFVRDGLRQATRRSPGLRPGLGVSIPSSSGMVCDVVGDLHQVSQNWNLFQSLLRQGWSATVALVRRIGAAHAAFQSLLRQGWSATRRGHVHPRRSAR